MKNEFELDDNKEQVEKAKKNLIFVGIMSVVMLFAGFTSAYIVSMGDSFWLKAPMPPAFWISTVIIAVSSIFMQLAVSFARKGNASGLKITIAITFLLGLAFTYSQYKGYGQLMDRGIHVTGSGIFVNDGRYGDYFTVSKDDKFIEVDGNDLLIENKGLTVEQIADYKAFMIQFIDTASTAEIKNYGKFKVYLHDRELILYKGKLSELDSTEMLPLDKDRLRMLAVNVRDGRGDFFARGKIGKDFHLYYKGKELQYKDGVLMKDGIKLDDYLQNKLYESPDTSSSYLYIITVVHLLHILITLLFMVRIVIHSFSGKINAEHNIQLRMASIFWHFLGLLWLYLLLFLLFIH